MSKREITFEEIITAMRKAGKLVVLITDPATQTFKTFYRTDKDALETVGQDALMKQMRSRNFTTQQYIDAWDAGGYCFVETFDHARERAGYDGSPVTAEQLLSMPKEAVLDLILSYPNIPNTDGEKHE